MDTFERTQTESDRSGSLSRDLARAMVALYKEHVGRGPTNARAYVDGDLIAVVLQETMIKAELTLAEQGEKDLVRDVRRVFQSKFRDEAKQMVEGITGRKVKAFLSDHAIDTDVAIEAFVLEPKKE